LLDENSPILVLDIHLLDILYFEVFLTAEGGKS